tara:strand:+ start:140 stop:1537 length:1398 start_codon:yes stop_codon:yes gene_type:complete
MSFCDIDDPNEDSSGWLNEMNIRFNQLREIFPSLKTEDELNIYLFENICEEYETYFNFKKDWLNHCGIEVGVISLIENNLNIKLLTDQKNKMNIDGNSYYQQTNPTLALDESVDNFIRQLKNSDLDLPYKYTFMVSHSHFMKHLLMKLYENNEHDLDETQLSTSRYQLNKILLDNAISVSKKNNKKSNEVYFNNLDILGIVRLKIKDGYLILDQFVLHNYDNYVIKDKLVGLEKIVSPILRDLGIEYNVDNISFIFITRHCYACHNTLNWLNRIKMFEPGYSKYSMCIPNKLKLNFSDDKIEGLINAINKIEEIYCNREVDKSYILENIMFGSSFILRAIITITILGKLITNKLSMDNFRSMKDISSKDLYCKNELTIQSKSWIDSYKKSKMDNCYSKYLEFHDFPETFPKIEPYDNFETYQQRLKDNNINLDLNRYTSFVNICDADCDYTQDDVDKMNYQFRYI